MLKRVFILGIAFYFGLVSIFTSIPNARASELSTEIRILAYKIRMRLPTGLEFAVLYAAMGAIWGWGWYKVQEYDNNNPNKNETIAKGAILGAITGGFLGLTVYYQPEYDSLSDFSYNTYPNLHIPQLDIRYSINRICDRLGGNDFSTTRYVPYIVFTYHF